MGSYGEAALKAVELIKIGKATDPRDAWKIATSQLFGAGTSMQRKGCPKGAFLGLCEEGFVKAIPSGHYIRSKKNKNKFYAVKAVSILKNNPTKNYTKNELWNEVIGNKHKKVHNQQMDVVLALWENGFIQ